VTGVQYTNYWGFFFKVNQGMIDKQVIERCVEQQSKSSDDKDQEDFIRIINAFDMPKYVYNQTKKTFDP
jgi:formiminotetrahydrofolate cyclodeaminase